MSTVHVLTPVTRPGNLQEIEASLSYADIVAKRYTVIWHVIADPGKRSVGGYSLRNEMLDMLHSPRDWVWFLDDDTTAHPLILQRLALVEDEHPGVQAMIVAQTRPGGWNPGCADPARLRNGAHPLTMHECAFDTGQAIIRRGLIGDYRFRTADRAGDGWLYEELLAVSDNVVYVDEVLSYYNSLRR